MRFQNGSNKVVIELWVVQFWSEIILVISNRTRSVRSFDFDITRMISDQIARPKVQLPLCKRQTTHMIVAIASDRKFERSFILIRLSLPSILESRFFARPSNSLNLVPRFSTVSPFLERQRREILATRLHLTSLLSGKQRKIWVRRKSWRSASRSTCVAFYVRDFSGMFYIYIRGIKI